MPAESPTTANLIDRSRQARRMVRAAIEEARAAAARWEEVRRARIRDGWEREQKQARVRREWGIGG